MMTTGKVFGEGSIQNRPEFGGVDPRQEYAQAMQNQEIANKELALAQNRATILQDAITKFLNKEITKAELETIQESLK